MKIEFDIIITTYNRPERVAKFIDEILKCEQLPCNVIVVDSSELPNEDLPRKFKVKYIRSSHKNQPYQRYLGASISSSKILCFFDDDLEITDPNIFKLILEPFNKSEIVGSSIAIDYHSSISTKINDGFINPQSSITKLFLRLTGVRYPENGRISYLGMAGAKPTQKQYVDFFYGPCMAFRRGVFMNTFYDDLLSLFEIKSGMGEDKIISMRASTYGKLLFNPTICLYHPAVESTYFSNLRNFTFKTQYSRALLNRVFTEVKNKNYLISTLNLYWYNLGRLIIALITLMIKQNSQSKDRFVGLLKGTKFNMNYYNLKKIDWHSEIQNDMKNYKLIS